MSTSIPQLNTASGGDVMSIFYTRFNAVANAMTNVVMTTAANSAGGVTTGNGSITGIFSASVISGGIFRGGIVASPATMNVISNVHITNVSSIFLIGNSSVNALMNSSHLRISSANIANAIINELTLQSSIQVGSTNFAYIQKVTTGTSNQIIDSFDIGQRSAEYVLSVKDNSANGYQLSKLLVIHDGTTAFSTEYAVLISNTSLISFSVSSNSTAVILSGVPTSSNTTIKATRTTIAV